MTWRVTGEEIFPRGDNPLGNRFYGYRKTSLELPDGRTATYHGLLVGQCVHVVGLESDLTTYVVEQSRPNVREKGLDAPVPTLLELPGGFVGEGVAPIDAAQEELEQEAGRHANKLEQVGVLYPSVGVSDERDHIFMGTDLVPVERRGDEATEQDMRVIPMGFGEAYDLMRRGDVPVAAQTLAAMALVATKL